MHNFNYSGFLYNLPFLSADSDGKYGSYYKNRSFKEDICLKLQKITNIPYASEHKVYCHEPLEQQSQKLTINC